MGVHVTPTLYAGDDPPNTDVPYARADTVAEAVEVINEGIAALSLGRVYVKAWVPDNDEFIREVLQKLGANDEWIDNRIVFARTGVVQPLPG